MASSSRAEHKSPLPGPTKRPPGRAVKRRVGRGRLSSLLGPENPADHLVRDGESEIASADGILRDFRGGTRAGIGLRRSLGARLSGLVGFSEDGRAARGGSFLRGQVTFEVF